MAQAVLQPAPAGVEGPHRTGAIIVAAGRSARMGGIDKVLQPLAGRPLIAHTLAAFADEPSIDVIAVVASEANWLDIEALVRTGFGKVAAIVLGGERRRDSVRAGIDALPDCNLLVVHDGARPLVTAELIRAALAGARETGAALCAVAVTDTVKRAGDDGLVRGSVAREGLWLAQTPQAFRRALLFRAHEEVDAAVDATDDCALVELLGEPVRLVPGSARNLKVTTEADLALAEALLRAGR